jgi:hypothetical protein
MDIETITKANGLLNTLQFLKSILSQLELLVGLSREHKDELKKVAQSHHDEVQKQLDTL